MLYFTRLSFSFLSYPILPSPFLRTRLSETWLVSGSRFSKVGFRCSETGFRPFIDLIPLLQLLPLRHKLGTAIPILANLIVHMPMPDGHHP